MKKTLSISCVLVLIGCGKARDSAPPVSAPPKAQELQTLPPSNVPAEELDCSRQPFASTIDIAEASGATWMADETLLVIGDSGTNGAFLTLNSESGVILSGGKLPLDDGASDDLEGLSRIGDRVYALTSSGYMREWVAKGEGFDLVQKSYRLARAEDKDLTCASGKSTNCGPNFEGLCLISDPAPSAPCVGFAAAKALGRLICLRQETDGRLSLVADHTISVASPKTLSGCHFDEEGRLWFGNNVFAANAVGFVTGHQQPESAVITRVGSLGLGFPEAIAVGPKGQVYRFSDTMGAPSLLDKYICRYP